MMGSEEKSIMNDPSQKPPPAGEIEPVQKDTAKEALLGGVEGARSGEPSPIAQRHG